MRIDMHRNTYPGPVFLSFEVCLTRGGFGLIFGFGHTDYIIEIHP